MIDACAVALRFAAASNFFSSGVILSLLLFSAALAVVNGDLAVVSGLANLHQALTLHVDVDKKELGFHPDFGCYVRSVMGAMNGPIAGQLAAFYVKSALIEDIRVNYVSSCTATVVGDVINVVATVIPISGKPLDLLLVV